MSTYNISGDTSLIKNPLSKNKCLGAKNTKGNFRIPLFNYILVSNHSFKLTLFHLFLFGYRFFLFP